MDDPYQMIAPMLPREEQEAWHYIHDNLNDLHWFAAQVRAASRLLDHCDELTAKVADRHDALSFIEWSYVAVRDAAINIYNFAQAKQAIHKLASESPTIRAHIDDAKKADARRLLEEAVPRFGLLRHSVGHAGELLATPRKRKENRFNHSPTVSTMIKGVVEERRYVATAGGKIVTFELTEAISDALFASAAAMDDSFLPLAAFTQKAFLETQQSKRRRRRED